MPWDNFLQEVHEGGQRIKCLKEDAGGDGEQAALFQELDAAKEELAVATEELTVQEEELTATAEMAVLWRRHYEQLFQLAPDGYLVTDLQGVIREANQAAAGLLGVEATFLSHKPLPLFVALPARAAFRAHLRGFQQKPGRQEWEVIIQPRHRSAFNACVSAAAMPDLDGRPSVLLWLIHAVMPSQPAE